MDLTSYNLNNMPKAAEQLIKNEIWKCKDFITNNNFGRAEHQELTKLVDNRVKVLEWIKERVYLPQYIDDLEGISEEERLKIWGISDIEDKPTT